MDSTSPQATSLVAWWPFDTPGGSLLKERSGGGYDGTLTDFIPAKVWQLDQTLGGAVIKFDGVAGFVSVPDAAALNLAIPFSVSGWIKYTTTGNLIVLEKNGNAGFSWQTNFSQPGKLQFNVGGTPADSPATLSLWNDGNWHHVAWVVTAASSTGCSVYVDGVSDTDASNRNTNAGPAYGASTAVLIGQRGSGGYGPLLGSLADIRFYNVALSGSQVSAIYAALTRWQLYTPKGRYLA